jgi:hypothetical protein
MGPKRVFQNAAEIAAFWQGYEDAMNVVRFTLAGSAAAVRAANKGETGEMMAAALDGVSGARPST